MFGIDWLRRGVPVDRETSVLTSEAEVIAGAKRRAKEIAKRHPGREPDSFRLRDATGGIFWRFPNPRLSPAAPWQELRAQAKAGRRRSKLGRVSANL
jgi:uncharacterized protein YcbX